MDNYIPPQEIPSELAVLSGMLHEDTYFWKAIERCSQEFFYVTELGNCFKEMADAKRHDEILIQRALSGTRYGIEDVYSAPFSTTGETEFQLLETAYIKRESVRLIQNARNTVLSEDCKNPTETIAELNTELARLSSGKTDRLVRFDDLMDGELQRQKAIVEKGTASFIQTGFKEIDEKVCIIKSDYIVVGARPSNGKSTLVGAICRNICRKGGVVAAFYLDTPAEVELSRAIFTEADLSLNDFNLGMVSKSHMPKVDAAMDKIRKMKYYVDSRRKMTPDKIFAKCQRIIAKEGRLDMVVVDFMQNVKYPIKLEKRELISTISDELHDFPYQLGCPVMALSQMARYQNENTTPPNNSNLKESGDIEEDADKILLLYRPEFYQKICPENKNESKRNLLEVYVSKNKNGPVGYIPLNFFGNTMKISDRVQDSPDLDDWRG